MRLADPYALFGLILVPLWLWMNWRWQRPAAISYSTTQVLSALPPSLNTRLYDALPILRVLVFVLCVLALARPQWGIVATEVKREGIVIDMVVDISRSMAALDLRLNGQERNRLDVVKAAFRSFVQGGNELAGRQGDRIGMVTFARYADSISPLTLDHELLLSLLDQVRIITLPEDNGTAIGEAIAFGVERLRQSKAASRVMILLTDGSNNAGVTEPLQAAQIARAFGIKIYTVGAGSHGVATVAIRLQSGEMMRQEMPVYIDEQTLTQIAKLTGGQYFRATDEAALHAIYAEIDRLEKTAMVAQHYRQYVDIFPWILLFALGLLLVEVVLANTRLRTLP